MQLASILTSIALLGPLNLLAHAPAQAQSTAVADAVMLEMGLDFKNGNARHLSTLLPKVRGHVLEPWAAYWELRAHLDSASGDEIRDFLKRYAGTYQEDRLRNDWLLLLGQRRDWIGFAAELPHYRMNDDLEVRCYALALESASTGVDRSAQVKHEWYAQKEADDGCTFAASQLYAAKKMSNADIWRKARLAMDADRPKMARTAVEIIAPEAAAPLDEITRNPTRFLAKRAVASGQVAKEWVLLALIRLAASEPDMAASVLENHWSVHLNPEQRSWAWGAIGKQATRRLAGNAMEYFAKTNDSALNDDHLAWKVRAALRQGQWKVVLAAIQAMSPQAQQESNWVYWQARALSSQASSEADRAKARQLFQSIASVRGFYEQLALEELGQRISAPTPPSVLTPQEKEDARRNAGLNRALYAIQIGLRSEGSREWNYSIKLHQNGGMSDRELLAAADLACQHEVWDRCINTSERTKDVIDFAQRFPLPHKGAVLQRTSQIGLDPAYVYGLIRQESRFVLDSRSSVGATGLMQIMPATARWTAKKIGLLNFKPQQLGDRDTNIFIGTGYLKLLLDNFGGSMPLVAAAYNAGPNRPRNWRGQHGASPLEAAIWIETVPFVETRDYVKKVLSNTTSYAALISGQSQSLKSRLGLVGPRSVDLAEASSDLP